MSQPQVAAKFVENIIYSGDLLIGGLEGGASRTAAEELSLLQIETNSASELLIAFRDHTSPNPKADLKIAFEHIDNALAHSRILLNKIGGAQADDMLHRSMQYFQVVLSDIPQVSFLTSRMIDTYHEIKDALKETRSKLDPVKM
jgi:hypothetical protein